jgi:hypothetical protein
MPDIQKAQVEVLFDESNPNWSSQPEYIAMFLKATQNYMNDLLLSQGHVFLNEVYDALGVSRTSAGALLGWTQGPEDVKVIEFNIQERPEDGFLIIDFNVEGIIFNKI